MCTGVGKYGTRTEQTRSKGDVTAYGSTAYALKNVSYVLDIMKGLAIALLSACIN